MKAITIDPNPLINKIRTKKEQFANKCSNAGKAIAGAVVPVVTAVKEYGLEMVKPAEVNYCPGCGTEIPKEYGDINFCHKCGRKI